MNRAFLSFAALLAIGSSPAALAVPDIALTSGVARSFNLPASAFTDSFYLDAPAGTTELTFELNGNTDVDLLLRYGTPFAGTETNPPSVDYLFESAIYRGISGEGNERITLGRHNVQPAREGRWYIIALNFDPSPSNTSIRATAGTGTAGNLPIEVVFTDSTGSTNFPCSISEWTDSTPRAPTGGNSGTTLGEQRRNAVLEAARLLGNELRSPVPIRIKACWANACDDPATPGPDNNRCSTNSGPIAFAGPNGYLLRAIGMEASGSGSSVLGLENAKFLPRPQTFYSITAATKLAGTRTCSFAGGSCASTYEVSITFNNLVGATGPLSGLSFWYGLSPSTTFGSGIDFVAVSMHEITHGLGFLSLVNLGSRTSQPLGAKLAGYDDIYSANVSRLIGDGVSAPQQVVPFTAISNEDRIAAATSFIGLRWNGVDATNSLDNNRRNNTPPDNMVVLYAPGTIQLGSTLSHLALAELGADLMLPTVSGAQRRLGIALPMLGAVGWSNAPAIAPTNNLPRPTLYFDRTRGNHGINFGRVFGDIYYLIFYTYDTAGNPEWYLAAGPVIDGIFQPEPDASGNSLLRIRLRPGQNPAQTTDAANSGQVRLDFNQAGLAPACNDGVQRDTTSPLGLMTWALAGQTRSWCMEAALPPSLRTTPDFTGAWASAESGWGFDMASFRAGNSNVLTGLVFYPDANGDGRWATFSTDQPQGSTALRLMQRSGYCRTCPSPATTPPDVDVGSITVTMTTPSQSPAAGNRANFDVTYRGGPGGRFQRNVPISLLSELQPQ